MDCKNIIKFQLQQYDIQHENTRQFKFANCLNNIECENTRRLWVAKCLKDIKGANTRHIAGAKCFALSENLPGKWPNLHFWHRFSSVACYNVLGYSLVFTLWMLPEFLQHFVNVINYIITPVYISWEIVRQVLANLSHYDTCSL